MGTGSISQILKHSGNAEFVSGKISELFANDAKKLTQTTFVEKLSGPNVRCHENLDEVTCEYVGYTLVEIDQVYGFYLVRKMPAKIITARVRISFEMRTKTIEVSVADSTQISNSYIYSNQHEL